jgi:hypothetical protein
MTMRTITATATLLLNLLQHLLLVGEEVGDTGVLLQF